MKARIAAALPVTMAFSLSGFAASGVNTDLGKSHAGPDRSEWIGRIRGARERVHSAQNLYVTTMLSYRQMKHRRRARGEEKLYILTLRKAAESELNAAEQDLDTLLEEARVAGVPPGWLRDAMAGPDPAAPAN